MQLIPDNMKFTTGDVNCYLQVEGTVGGGVARIGGEGLPSWLLSFGGGGEGNACLGC